MWRRQIECEFERVQFAADSSEDAFADDPMSVEPEAELAQQGREALLLGGGKPFEQLGLGIDEPGDRRIHARETGRGHLHEDAPAVAKAA